MKNHYAVYMILLFTSFRVLVAIEFSSGITMAADAVQLGIEAGICPGVSILLKGGPAWEREADFKINDALFNLTFKYTSYTDAKFSPFFILSHELFLVNTGYATTVATGSAAGMGLRYSLNKKNSIFISGGVRQVSGIIDSDYEDENFRFYYSELWRAPVSWFNLGWSSKI